MREMILIGSLALAASVYAATAQPIEGIKAENQRLRYELRDAESQRDRIQKEFDQLKREYEIYQDGVKDSR